MKILFVDSTVIGENSPTGMTLANIFANLKDCEVLQYCIDYDPSFHTPVYQTIYENKNVNLLFYILKKIYRKRYSSKAETGENVTWVSTNGRPIASIAKLYLDCIHHRVSKKDVEQIKDFSPDIIYALGGTITSLRTATLLSKKLNIPIVLHVMDDWFSTKYLDCKYTIRGNKIINKEAKELIDRTYANIGISEKMADYLKKKFNKPFGYAMNCLDQLHYKPVTHSDKCRIVFSGGIHGGREKSLLEIGSIIQEDKNLAAKTELCIYTSNVCIERYSSLLSSVAKIYPYVPRNQMYENLSNADVLLHVESFEQYEIDYFRYSLSTKIPEYMSAGRPILVYGPREIGTVSYVEESKVGLVASGHKELIEAISELINDSSLREKISQKALLEAQNEHMGEAVANRVKKILNLAYNRGNI